MTLPQVPIPHTNYTYPTDANSGAHCGEMHVQDACEQLQHSRVLNTLFRRKT